ncbi:hypothetical protein AAHC03_01615 [Spirometra sp. Aus1]
MIFFHTHVHVPRATHRALRALKLVARINFFGKNGPIDLEEIVVVLDLFINQPFRVMYSYCRKSLRQMSL